MYTMKSECLLLMLLMLLTVPWKSDASELPYQANLVISSPGSDDEENCSASLIHERWLLSAAHCLRNLKWPRRLRVTLGSTSFLGGTGYEHETCVLHEKWKLGPDFDIALIRLKESVRFDNETRPVGLPGNDTDEFEDDEAILSSWGQAGLDVPALELQAKKLTILSRKQCHRRLLRLIRKMDKPEDVGFFLKAVRRLNTLVCTDGAQLHHGDSGGPLVVNGTQIGVASSSYGSQLGLFTRVSSFVEWIRARMDEYRGD